ncbi:hypothetical protein V6N13_099371 [Hibiscus sabdariffa]|uniref:Uncharacterized protein n=1 Tax=Hibiscus sabdariffa TaxID=183260 RepID=A0ABR2PZH6_9ROSI
MRYGEVGFVLGQVNPREGIWYGIGIGKELGRFISWRVGTIFGFEKIDNSMRMLWAVYASSRQQAADQTNGITIPCHSPYTSCVTVRSNFAFSPWMQK